MDAVNRARFKGVSFTEDIEIKISNLKYKLRPGSALLKVSTWQTLSQRELKSLIQRFSTRESSAVRKCDPKFYFWRLCRFKAVEVYEKRFSETPKIFKSWKLPLLKSYYVKDDQYIWSSKGMK